MRKNNVFFVLMVLVFAGMVSAATFNNGVTSVQYYSPSIGDLYSSGDISKYWPGLGSDIDSCDAVSDFWIGISPAGCSPMVVRSDLLEEQDVPVFCQLYAVQINPLIEVFSIDSISFKGKYPDGVSGISYYPAQAALKSQKTLSGTPVTSNIGYVVILLKQEKVEANMADWIAGNLTATIKYDAQSAFGTGKARYYLDASANRSDNSFWNGMGYLRLKGVSGDEATIEIYDGDNVFRTISLDKGKTSSTVYFPDYYCRAGLQLRLNDVVSMESSALLSVDGDDIWVRKGSRFLNDKCSVASLDANKDGSGKIKISCSGGESFVLSLTKKGDGTELKNVQINEDALKAFGLGENTVEDLIERYRVEKEELLDYTYGEKALYDQIVLAEEAGQAESEFKLIELFVQSYPNSKLLKDVEDRRLKIVEYNFAEAVRSVYVGNDYHIIGVEKFRNVSKEDKKINFLYNGIRYTGIVEGQKVYVGSDYILASKISSSSVIFKYYKSNKFSDDETVKEGEYGTLNSRDIRVDDIDFTEVADISLIPVVNDKTSEANFSFAVGIEKRAIELSPEKTELMIKNLNRSIEEWNNINARLGDLVTGLKGACFATSAFLTVKNFVSGMSGEALARKKVMTKYKEICSTDPRYRDMTATQCYNTLSSQIDADVKTMTAALNGVNSNVDSVLSKYSDDGAIKDNDAYVKELRGKVSEGWSYKGLKRDDLTGASQISSVLLYESLGGASGSGVAWEAAQSDMNKSLDVLVSEVEAKKRGEIATASFKNDLNQELDTVVITTANSRVYSWGGKTAEQGLVDKINSVNTNKIAVGDKVQGVTVNDVNYLLKLTSGATGRLTVQTVYLKEGDSYREKSYSGKDNDVSPFVGVSFDPVRVDKCSYVWKSAAPELSYYESGGAKGKPALVPFDLSRGWYAKVSSDAYTEAGDVTRFNLCNIGSDGVVGGTVADTCQTFDSNTASVVQSIGGCDLKSEDVAKLYSTARSAILEASRQYGKTTVTINGKSLMVGKPTGISTAYECQDFMSPGECKLLFNVCDPVICPASRCDLGGEMPVSDVIQTGIIGSTLLCLPNSKEGVMIPVCLTGIHAGLENYISILESERDCLETSLATGENVGICDEVTSIYLCEFFWNQFSSFADKIASTLFGKLFGGSEVKGGGEYMLIDQAWESTQGSISYFKDYYAQNAFAAFNAKNVASAGGEVCQAFIGSSVPTSADMIDSLLEPESPTQFYATFSSEPFSEATVPVTAQYKVYFHIYAGEDRGVQYRVYLKDPPATSYYASHPTVEFDRNSGYIAAGESADEAVDFTAPEGYKQLCVNINGKEECGFRSVSTSIAADYVAAKYAEDQATDVDIKSEDECISGKSSLWSLANPNLQAGASETVGGDISLEGVVRVCATANPGNSVGESSRWREVGYCGEEAMKCWLDYTSVKDALKTVAAVEGTTVSELANSAGILEGGSMKYEDVTNLIVNLEKSIEAFSSEQLKSYETDAGVLSVFASLNKIGGIGDDFGEGTNVNRARAYMLKAKIYQKAVREFLKLGGGKVVDQGAREAIEDTYDLDAGVGVDGSYVGVGEGGEPVSESNPNADLVKAVRGVPEVNSNCEQYVGLVRQEAAKYSEFDEYLLLALMQKESSCDWTSFSGSSYGLMQISSFEMCSDIGAREEIIENVEKNIACGALILHKKYEDYGSRTRAYKCNAFVSTYVDKNGETKVRQNEAAIDVTYTGIEAALRAYNGWGCAGYRADGTEIFADHDYVKRVLEIAELARVYDSGASSRGATQSVNEDVAKIEQAIKDAGLADWVEASTSSDSAYTVEIKSALPLLFDKDSYALAREYNVFLDKFSKFILTYSDYKVKTVGYRDSSEGGTLDSDRALTLFGFLRKEGVEVFSNEGLGVASSSEIAFNRRGEIMVFINLNEVAIVSNPDVVGASGDGFGDNQAAYLAYRTSCNLKDGVLVYLDSCKSQGIVLQDIQGYSFPAGMVCCKDKDLVVGEENAGGVLNIRNIDKNDGISDDGIALVAIFYREGVDDFVYYYWNVDENKLEWRVMTRGFLVFDAKEVCPWGSTSVCDETMSSTSSAMHKVILNQGSWDEVVRAAKNYKAHGDSISVEVNFFDAFGDVLNL